MENCVFHPEHAAIEPCEICQKPLCGLCLWYTADGHRLCEAHARQREAQGERVLPPHAYEEALAPSLRRSAASVGSADAPGVYRGNSNDVGALVAATVALSFLFSCAGGAYCLPVAIFLLGLAVFLNADQAIDPRRTKLLAGIGMGIVGLMIVALFAFFVLYLAFFLLMFSLGGP